TSDPQPEKVTRYSEFGSMDLNGNLLPTDAGGRPLGRVAWEDAMTAAQAANYTLGHILGPASFWNTPGAAPDQTTQPKADPQTGEVQPVTYLDQAADSWNPIVQLSALPGALPGDS